jgi:transcriptional regulator with XRE-family HTH domain
MKKTIYSRDQERLQVLLREFREAKGLTQRDIAKRLGVPQSFVSKYESGERRLDLPELRQVCTALEITLSDLVKRFEK